MQRSVSCSMRWYALLLIRQKPVNYIAEFVYRKLLKQDVLCNSYAAARSQSFSLVFFVCCRHLFKIFMPNHKSNLKSHRQITNYFSPNVIISNLNFNQIVNPEMLKFHFKKHTHDNQILRKTTWKLYKTQTTSVLCENTVCLRLAAWLRVVIC